MSGVEVIDEAVEPLSERYCAIRERTVRLASSLSAEDQQIQAFAEASPTKWHLGHTTWFFETFVLAEAQIGWAPIHPAHAVLFNSYYEGVGERHPRPQRGLLSRPRLEEVQDYRRRVDEAVLALLGARPSSSLLERIELGLNHEEQHQELLLTDILANFSVSPLRPSWRDEPIALAAPPPEPRWVQLPAGLAEIGHQGTGFHYDNEGPRHRVFHEGFALRSTAVSCAEMIAFIEDRGYETPSLWLSDGIAWVREHAIDAPRYWRRDRDGRWLRHTLYGEQPVDPNAPLTHVSGYEAEAIAGWLGARLPTEQEWEVAARRQGGDPGAGRWLEDGQVVPGYPAEPSGEGAFHGLWGETWEWTRSAYAPYPGYRPATGAVGEYNGKFMANQWVLRGGSCATPKGHIRATYRNFFYPHERWQFTGVRLAQDTPLSEP